MSKQHCRMLQVERFFWQSGTLLRHCCWCGRGFIDERRIFTCHGAPRKLSATVALRVFFASINLNNYCTVLYKNNGNRCIHALFVNFLYLYKNFDSWFARDFLKLRLHVCNPRKWRHSRWKLSQELNWKIISFLAEYIRAKMASRK